MILIPTIKLYLKTSQLVFMHCYNILQIGPSDRRTFMRMSFNILI